MPISDYSGDARIGYAAAAWVLRQCYPKGIYPSCRGSGCSTGIDVGLSKGNKIFNLTSGNFQLTSQTLSTSTFAADVLTIYNAALAANFDPSGYVDAHSPPGSDIAYPQDYVIPNPVPLPGAVLLIGAGLTRIVAYARREKRCHRLMILTKRFSQAGLVKSCMGGASLILDCKRRI